MWVRPSTILLGKLEKRESDGILLSHSFTVCGGGRVLPRQLPEREQDGQLVVELLELIKSAEDELGLVVTFPQEPHHIRLQEHSHAVTTVTGYITTGTTMR